MFLVFFFYAIVSLIGLWFFLSLIPIWGIKFRAGEDDKWLIADPPCRGRTWWGLVFGRFGNKEDHAQSIVDRFAGDRHNYRDGKDRRQTYKYVYHAGNLQYKVTITL